MNESAIALAPQERPPSAVQVLAMARAMAVLLRRDGPRWCGQPGQPGHSGCIHSFYGKRPTTKFRCRVVFYERNWLLALDM